MQADANEPCTSLRSQVEHSKLELLQLAAMHALHAGAVTLRVIWVQGPAGRGPCTHLKLPWLWLRMKLEGALMGPGGTSTSTSKPVPVRQQCNTSPVSCRTSATPLQNPAGPHVNRLGVTLTFTPVCISSSSERGRRTSIRVEPSCRIPDPRTLARQSVMARHGLSSRSIWLHMLLNASKMILRSHAVHFTSCADLQHRGPMLAMEPCLPSWQDCTFCSSFCKAAPSEALEPTDVATMQDGDSTE